jgi:hypothetical protein
MPFRHPLLRLQGRLDRPFFSAIVTWIGAEDSNEPLSGRALDPQESDAPANPGNQPHAAPYDRERQILTGGSVGLFLVRLVDRAAFAFSHRLISLDPL